MSKESTHNIEIYHQALQLMEENSSLRDHMYVRIAERVTMVTRFGLFMLIIIAISIYLLLNTLNSQVVHMLSGIETMNQSFSSVKTDMQKIQQDMNNIRSKSIHMIDIRDSTESVAQTLKNIQYSVSEASNSIRRISFGMHYVDQSMAQVNQNIYPLSLDMSNISRDMYSISEPFEAFNELIP